MANALLTRPSQRLIVEFALGALPLPLPASLGVGPWLVSSEDRDVPGLLRAGRTHYHALVLADGPLGYWRLAEITGLARSSAPGGAGNAAPVGGVTMGVAGPLRDDTGTAWTFDGTSGYATVTASNSFDVGDTFVLECWLRAAANPAAQALLFGRRNASTSSNGSPNLCLTTTGKLRAVARGLGTIATGAVTLTDNVWHHVAWAKAGANTRLFVDGVDDTGAVTNQTCTDVGTSWRLGGGSGEYFGGSLAQVASYPAVASPRTILDRYAAAQWWTQTRVERRLLGDPTFTQGTSNGYRGGLPRVAAFSCTLANHDGASTRLLASTARGVPIRVHTLDTQTGEFIEDAAVGVLAVAEASGGVVTVTAHAADATRAREAVPQTVVTPSDFPDVPNGGGDVIAWGTGLGTVTGRPVRAGDVYDYALATGNVGVLQIRVGANQEPRLWSNDWADGPYELRQRTDTVFGQPVTVARFDSPVDPVEADVFRGYRDYDAATIAEFKWLQGFQADGADGFGGIRDCRVLDGALTTSALVVGPQNLPSTLDPALAVSNDSSSLVVPPLYDGRFGAVQFDGASVLVSRLYGQAGAIHGMTQRLSLEAWVYPDSTATQVVLQSPGGNPATFSGWQVLLAGSGALFRYGAGGAWVNLLCVGIVPLRTWSFVAVVLDADNETLYLNRLPVVSRARTAAIVYDTAALDLTFGAEVSGGVVTGSYFTGRLGCVRLSGDAIAPTEIAETYWRMRSNPMPLVRDAIAAGGEHPNGASMTVLAEDLDAVTDGVTAGALKAGGYLQAQQAPDDVLEALTPIRQLRFTRRYGACGARAAKPALLTYVDVVAADHPAGWWRCTDTVIGASTPVARDWSGTGLDGVATACTFNLAGPLTDPASRGVMSAGSAGAGLSCGRGRLLPALNLGAAFSVETWVRTPTFSPYQTLVAHADAGTGTGWGVSLGSSGQVRVQLVGPVRSLDTGGVGTAVADGGWHHVAVLADPNRVRVFADGVLVATIVGAWDPVDLLVPVTLFGSAGEVFGARFGGTLSEVAVYDHLVDPGHLALRVALARQPVDTPLDAGTFGVADGVWNNARLERRTRASLAEAVATLPVQYRLRPAGAPLSFTVPVLPVGSTADPLVLPFTADATSADLIAQLEAARMVAGDELLELTVGHEARGVQPGHGVTIVAPGVGL